MMLDSVQAFVAQQTGLPAIWRNANSPRPDRPFASLYITAINALGMDEYGPFNDDDNQIIIGQRTANVSVQFHGDASEHDPRQALMLATDLQNNLRANPEAIEPVSLLTDPQIINIPQVAGSQWEQQASIDIMVGFEVHTQRDIEWIERVTGVGAVESNDGVLYSEPFDVTI